MKRHPDTLPKISREGRKVCITDYLALQSVPRFKSEARDRSSGGDSEAKIGPEDSNQLTRSGFDVFQFLDEHVPNQNLSAAPGRPASQESAVLQLKDMYQMFCELRFFAKEGPFCESAAFSRFKSLRDLGYFQFQKEKHTEEGANVEALMGLARSFLESENNEFGIFLPGFEVYGLRKHSTLSKIAPSLSFGPSECSKYLILCFRDKEGLLAKKFQELNLPVEELPSLGSRFRSFVKGSSANFVLQMIADLTTSSTSSPLNIIANFPFERATLCRASMVVSTVPATSVPIANYFTYSPKSESLEYLVPPTEKNVKTEEQFNKLEKFRETKLVVIKPALFGSLLKKTLKFLTMNSEDSRFLLTNV